MIAIDNSQSLLALAYDASCGLATNSEENSCCTNLKPSNLLPIDPESFPVLLFQLGKVKPQLLNSKKSSVLVMPTKPAILMAPVFDSGTARMENAIDTKNMGRADSFLEQECGIDEDTPLLDKLWSFAGKVLLHIKADPVVTTFVQNSETVVTEKNIPTYGYLLLKLISSADGRRKLSKWLRRKYSRDALHSLRMPPKTKSSLALFDVLNNLYDHDECFKQTVDKLVKMELNASHLEHKDNCLPNNALMALIEKVSLAHWFTDKAEGDKRDWLSTNDEEFNAQLTAEEFCLLLRTFSSSKLTPLDDFLKLATADSFDPNTLKRHGLTILRQLSTARGRVEFNKWLVEFAKSGRSLLPDYLTNDRQFTRFLVRCCAELNSPNDESGETSCQWLWKKNSLEQPTSLTLLEALELDKNNVEHLLDEFSSYSRKAWNKYRNVSIDVVYIQEADNQYRIRVQPPRNKRHALICRRYRSVEELNLYVAYRLRKITGQLQQADMALFNANINKLVHPQDRTIPDATDNALLVHRISNSRNYTDIKCYAPDEATATKVLKEKKECLMEQLKSIDYTKLRVRGLRLGICKYDDEPMIVVGKTLKFDGAPKPLFIPYPAFQDITYTNFDPNSMYVGLEQSPSFDSPTSIFIDGDEIDVSSVLPCFTQNTADFLSSQNTDSVMLFDACLALLSKIFEASKDYLLADFLNPSFGQYINESNLENLGYKLLDILLNKDMRETFVKEIKSQYEYRFGTKRKCSPSFLTNLFKDSCFTKRCDLWQKHRAREMNRILEERGLI